jgi:hypothetical protein
MSVLTDEQEIEHQFSMIKQYVTQHKIDPKLIGDLFSIGRIAASLLNVIPAPKSYTSEELESAKIKRIVDAAISDLVQTLQRQGAL